MGPAEVVPHYDSSPSNHNNEIENDKEEVQLTRIPIQQLGIAAVVGLSYFNISGGPFGSEEIISSAGPFIGLIGIAIFPFLWGLQISLITAELSCLFPSNCAYSVWVGEAFGEFWAFQESYWIFISCTFNSALYPMLTYQTVFNNYENIIPWYYAYIFKFMLLMMYTIPTLYQLNVVGRSLFIGTGIVLLPFILTMFIGLPQANWNIILQPQTSTLSFNSITNLVSVLYWNMSGMESIASVAAEVKNPKRTLPISLLITTFLSMLSMLLPLGVAAAVNKPPWQTWTGGSWSQIAASQVGPWMYWIFIIMSVLSNFGQYVSVFMQDTWQLCGMAECGLVPPFFAKKCDKYGSPLNSIYFGVICVAIIMSFHYNTVLAVNNFFACLKSLLILGAFLKLRRSQPTTKRLFRIPINSLIGEILFITPPLITGLIVVALTFMESEASILINLIGIVCGLILFFGMKYIVHIKYKRNIIEETEQDTLERLEENNLYEPIITG